MNTGLFLIFQKTSYTHDLNKITAQWVGFTSAAGFVKEARHKNLHKRVCPPISSGDRRAGGKPSSVPLLD